MARAVTHETFQDDLANVEDASVVFYVPTQARTIVVNAQTIIKWRKAGREVIALDKDGKGFRLGSGRRTVYVLAGQLMVSS